MRYRAEDKLIEEHDIGYEHSFSQWVSVCLPTEIHSSKHAVNDYEREKRECERCAQCKKKEALPKSNGAKVI